MKNSETDPTKRFANRVEHYIKYRPKYPHAVIEFLTTKLNLKPSDIIADIGCGTGIFTEMLLDNGNEVYGIEPNNEMRNAAETLLNKYSKFRSKNGTAEDTTLPVDCVNFIFSAQAFHWFKREKAKIEFQRILKKNGWVVLLWNSRVNDSSQFMNEYENFLKIYSVDYNLVSHTNIDKFEYDSFFSSYEVMHFPNQQSFNFEGLKGRLLSSSYAPDENHPDYNITMKKLESLFHKFEKNETVEFIYDTEMYYGRI